MTLKFYLDDEINNKVQNIFKMGKFNNFFNFYNWL
jgi:hypothetical protein